MKLSAAQRATVRDIEAICSAAADSRTLRERVAARMSRLIYWDAACFANHLKSIFAKVGVRSRGQLVARLLEEPYPSQASA